MKTTVPATIELTVQGDPQRGMVEGGVDMCTLWCDEAFLRQTNFAKRMRCYQKFAIYSLFHKYSVLPYFCLRRKASDCGDA